MRRSAARPKFVKKVFSSSTIMFSLASHHEIWQTALTSVLCFRSPCAEGLCRSTAWWAWWDAGCSCSAAWHGQLSGCPSTECVRAKWLTECQVGMASVLLMFPVLYAVVVFRSLPCLMVTVEHELLSLQQRIFTKIWPKSFQSVSFKRSKHLMFSKLFSQQNSDFHALLKITFGSTHQR